MWGGRQTLPCHSHTSPQPTMNCHFLLVTTLSNLSFCVVFVPSQYCEAKETEFFCCPLELHGLVSKTQFLPGLLGRYWYSFQCFRAACKRYPCVPRFWSRQHSIRPDMLRHSLHHSLLAWYVLSDDVHALTGQVSLSLWILHSNCIQPNLSVSSQTSSWPLGRGDFFAGQRG